MTTKLYKGYVEYTMVSGEVRRYPVTRKYKATKTYTLPTDTIDTIIRKHRDGIPSTRIARDIGITPERVRRVIKKHAQSQLQGPSSTAPVVSTDTQSQDTKIII